MFNGLIDKNVLNHYKNCHPANLYCQDWHVNINLLFPNLKILLFLQCKFTTVALTFR
jgi:hypothetical protein